MVNPFTNEDTDDRHATDYAAVLAIPTAATVAPAEVNADGMDRIVLALVQGADGTTSSDSFESYELGLFDHIVTATVRGAVQTHQSTDLVVDASGLSLSGVYSVRLASGEAGEIEHTSGAFFTSLGFTVSEIGTYLSVLKIPPCAYSHRPGGYARFLVVHAAGDPGLPGEGQGYQGNHGIEDVLRLEFASSRRNRPL